MIRLLLLLALMLSSASPLRASTDPEPSRSLPALAADAGATVLAVGDSLTAGWNVPAADNYPSRLGRRIAARVVNGGVNGDTSAGLLARLPSLLARHRPDLVILCIGGNDLLRRQSIEALRANLERAVDLSRQAGAEVLLMAVPVPFTQQDHPVYRRVAEAKGVALVSGVASRLQASDFQFDGVHPNGAGYARITDAVAEVLG